MNVKRNEKKRTKEQHALYTTISTLSETEVKSTHHLINKMCYPKRQKARPDFSTHLQNKAAKFITITSWIYNK